jgi:hypothetical protein
VDNSVAGIERSNAVRGASSLTQRNVDLESKARRYAPGL